MIVNYTVKEFLCKSVYNEKDAEVAQFIIPYH